MATPAQSRAHVSDEVVIQETRTSVIVSGNSTQGQVQAPSGAHSPGWSGQSSVERRIEPEHEESTPPAAPRTINCCLSIIYWFLFIISCGLVNLWKDRSEVPAPPQPDHTHSENREVIHEGTEAAQPVQTSSILRRHDAFPTLPSSSEIVGNPAPSMPPGLPRASGQVSADREDQTVPASGIRAQLGQDVTAISTETSTSPQLTQGARAISASSTTPSTSQPAQSSVSTSASTPQVVSGQSDPQTTQRARAGSAPFSSATPSSGQSAQSPASPSSSTSQLVSGQSDPQTTQRPRTGSAPFSSATPSSGQSAQSHASPSSSTSQLVSGQSATQVQLSPRAGSASTSSSTSQVVSDQNDPQTTQRTRAGSTSTSSTPSSGQSAQSPASASTSTSQLVSGQSATQVQLSPRAGSASTSSSSATPSSGQSAQSHASPSASTSQVVSDQNDPQTTQRPRAGSTSTTTSSSSATLSSGQSSQSPSSPSNSTPQVVSGQSATQAQQRTRVGSASSSASTSQLGSDQNDPQTTQRPRAGSTSSTLQLVSDQNDPQATQRPRAGSTSSSSATSSTRLPSQTTTSASTSTSQITTDTQTIPARGRTTSSSASFTQATDPTQPEKGPRRRGSSLNEAYGTNPRVPALIEAFNVLPINQPMTSAPHADLVQPGRIHLDELPSQITGIKKGSNPTVQPASQPSTSKGSLTASSMPADIGRRMSGPPTTPERPNQRTAPKTPKTPSDSISQRGAISQSFVTTQPPRPRVTDEDVEELFPSVTQRAKNPIRSLPASPSPAISVETVAVPIPTDKIEELTETSTPKSGIKKSDNTDSLPDLEPANAVKHDAESPQTSKSGAAIPTPQAKDAQPDETT